MNIYLEAFGIFFKIGAFTIGGGYAMVPLIENEIVTKRKWIAQEDFIDLLAISQSAPGILAVNISIFRSEEHTSELQSHHDILCRLLLEKKKKGVRWWVWGEGGRR